MVVGSIPTPSAFFVPIWEGLHLFCILCLCFGQSRALCAGLITNNNPLHQLQRAAQGHGRARQIPQAPRLQTDSHVDPTALLMPRPRTLYQLWDEYIRGIGNNKPAKYFTRAERGKFKFKYSRRKVLWDLIERLNRAGVSLHSSLHSHF